MARFVFLILSARETALAELTRRFDLEMGIAADPAPLDFRAEDGRFARWLAVAPPGDPARLASLQAHANRAAALYGMDGGRPAVEIQSGYIDGFKIVRAAAENSSRGVYLGGRVWGEIVAATGEGSVIGFGGADDSSWASADARCFLEAIWRMTM